MQIRSLLVYIAVIYLISWLLQLFAIFGTSGINSDAAELILACTMLVPTIVTTFYLVKYRSLRAKVLWKPNINIINTVLLGVLIPTTLAFLVVLVFLQVGYGSPGWFSFSNSGVTITGGPWLLGVGHNSWFIFGANFMLTAFFYSFISGIPAAGEEFAWRGVLQGVFIDRWGRTRGIVILGLVWSFWHLPALLAGYNHPDYPILGSFVLQPIQEVSISFFLAWLTLSSRSFIPAAIAHGAGNSIQEGVLSNIDLTVPVIYKDLFIMLLTVIIGIAFWYVLKDKK